MISIKKMAFFMLFLLLTAIILFCFGEISLLILSSQESPWQWRTTDYFSGFKGTPGYVYNTHNIKKTINKFGFISTPDINLIKPKGTIRIVFLGESSTAGTGGGVLLSDNDTWPAQTLELLRKRFPNLRFDFINGALGGYTSFESYGRLWGRIRFFNPDIIIVCHGWNEMYYFNRDSIDNIVELGKNQDEPKTFSNTGIHKKIMRILRRHYSPLLAAFQPFFNKSDIGERSSKRKDTDLPETYDKRGLEIWRKNLQLIKMTSNLIGSKLFVCKQGTLIVPGLPPEQQNRCSYYFHGFNHKAHLDAFNNIYKVIDEELDPEAIIDLTSISGIPEYFTDHIHPTVEGARRIAEIVSNKIIDYIASSDENIFFKSN